MTTVAAHDKNDEDVRCHRFQETRGPEFRSAEQKQQRAERQKIKQRGDGP